MTRDSSKGAVYLKLVNASSIPQPIEISLSGVANVAKTGTLLSLTGTDNAETNTISDPRRIVPVKTTLHNAGPRFSHIVPSYSIQILELGTK